MRIKNIVVLGSTGSIGINTLKVIENYPDKFNVVGLTAYNNFKLLEKQIRKFKPSHVAVSRKGVVYLKKTFSSKRVKFFDVCSRELSDIVELPNVDIVVIGMSGSAALYPFLAAVRSGKTVAPANKEALVIAGEILMSEAKRCNSKVIPVDSEQSAIFQCIEGNNRFELNKVFLTASGGALRSIPRSRFDRLTLEDILRHPRWKMGRKITVDSATMMNKGFEVIEAKRLFGLNVDEIEVVIHPEAVIHSMVEFKDGSIIAQLGITDMRLPIQYALTYPERWDSNLQPLDLFRLGRMNFLRPDLKKFPALSLAFHVAREGGSLPSVLNAADEIAVDHFLKGEITFSGIYNTVEKVVLRYKNKKKVDVKDILEADEWARKKSAEIVGRYKKG